MNPLQWTLLILAADLVFDSMVIIMGRKFYKRYKRNKNVKGWVNRWYRNEVHCLPPNDLMEHTPEDCGCSPKTEPVPREDGSMNWLVVHNALDGRV